MALSRKARLASRPLIRAHGSRSLLWRNEVPDAIANKLLLEHKLPIDRSLADRLNEAVWRYRRRARVTERQSRLETAAAIEAVIYAKTMPSLPAAAIVALVLAGVRSEDLSPGLPINGEVRAVARQVRESDRMSANATEGWSRGYVLRILYRSLAALHSDGTGRRPSAAHRGNVYRGTTYRFIADCCRWLNIPAHPKAIEQEVSAIRKFRIEREEKISN